MWKMMREWTIARLRLMGDPQFLPKCFFNTSRLYIWHEKLPKYNVQSAPYKNLPVHSCFQGRRPQRYRSAKKAYVQIRQEPGTCCQPIIIISRMCPAIVWWPDQVYVIVLLVCGLSSVLGAVITFSAPVDFPRLLSLTFEYPVMVNLFVPAEMRIFVVQLQKRPPNLR